jgi:peptidoglycan hydrolase CwlO-like protein
MRKRIALALVAAAVLVPAAAGGSHTGAQTAPTQEQLEVARRDRAAARAELRRLEAGLEALRRRALRVERRVGRAALRVVEAIRAQREAERRLEEARAQLRERMQAAYLLGPAGALDLVLSADSMGDLFAMREFADAAVGVDAELVDVAARARAELEVARETAEDAREPLLRRQAELRDLLARMQLDLRQAEETAERAGLRVRRLEEEQAALEEAIRRAEEREEVGGGDFDGGVNQDELLALLGPTGGRTCEIPDGLRDTGRDIAGLATWYGWEFAGQATASGAIFDPRLFTAAHRTLPLGSFLRVRRGERCAIVLVNDRGPFGDAGRILDLSMAAARHLGVGVSGIRADVLVRA